MLNSAVMRLEIQEIAGTQAPAPCSSKFAAVVAQRKSASMQKMAIKKMAVPALEPYTYSTTGISLISFRERMKKHTPSNAPPCSNSFSELISDGTSSPNFRSNDEKFFLDRNDDRSQEGDVSADSILVVHRRVSETLLPTADDNVRSEELNGEGMHNKHNSGLNIADFSVNQREKCYETVTAYSLSRAARAGSNASDIHFSSSYVDTNRGSASEPAAADIVPPPEGLTGKHDDSNSYQTLLSSNGHLHNFTDNDLGCEIPVENLLYDPDCILEMDEHDFISAAEESSSGCGLTSAFDVHEDVLYTKNYTISRQDVFTGVDRFDRQDVNFASIVRDGENSSEVGVDNDSVYARNTIYENISMHDVESNIVSAKLNEDQNTVCHIRYGESETCENDNEETESISDDEESIISLNKIISSISSTNIHDNLNKTIPYLGSSTDSCDDSVSTAALENFAISHAISIITTTRRNSELMTSFQYNDDGKRGTDDNIDNFGYEGVAVRFCKDEKDYEMALQSLHPSLPLKEYCTSKNTRFDTFQNRQKVTTTSSLGQFLQCQPLMSDLKKSNMRVMLPGGGGGGDGGGGGEGNKGRAVVKGMSQERERQTSPTHGDWQRTESKGRADRRLDKNDVGYSRVLLNERTLFSNNNNNSNNSNDKKSSGNKACSIEVDRNEDKVHTVLHPCSNSISGVHLDLDATPALEGGGIDSTGLETHHIHQLACESYLDSPGGKLSGGSWSLSSTLPSCLLASLSFKQYDLVDALAASEVPPVPIDLQLQLQPTESAYFDRIEVGGDESVRNHSHDDSDGNDGNDNFDEGAISGDSKGGGAVPCPKGSKWSDMGLGHEYVLEGLMAGRMRVSVSMDGDVSICDSVCVDDDSADDTKDRGEKRGLVNRRDNHFINRNISDAGGKRHSSRRGGTGMASVEEELQVQVEYSGRPKAVVKEKLFLRMEGDNEYYNRRYRGGGRGREGGDLEVCASARGPICTDANQLAKELYTFARQRTPEAPFDSLYPILKSTHSNRGSHNMRLKESNSKYATRNNRSELHGITDDNEYRKQVQSTEKNVLHRKKSKCHKKSDAACYDFILESDHEERSSVPKTSGSPKKKENIIMLNYFESRGNSKRNQSTDVQYIQVPKSSTLHGRQGEFADKAKSSLLPLSRTASVEYAVSVQRVLSPWRPASPPININSPPRSRSNSRSHIQSMHPLTPTLSRSPCCTPSLSAPHSQSLSHSQRSNYSSHQNNNALGGGGSVTSASSTASTANSKIIKIPTATLPCTDIVTRRDLITDSIISDSKLDAESDLKKAQKSSFERQLQQALERDPVFKSLTEKINRNRLRVMSNDMALSSYSFNAMTVPRAVTPWTRGNTLDPDPDPATLNISKGGTDGTLHRNKCGMTSEYDAGNSKGFIGGIVRRAHDHSEDHSANSDGEMGDSDISDGDVDGDDYDDQGPVSTKCIKRQNRKEMNYLMQRRLWESDQLLRQYSLTHFSSAGSTSVKVNANNEMSFDIGGCNKFAIELKKLTVNKSEFEIFVKNKFNSTMFKKENKTGMNAGSITLRRTMKHLEPIKRKRGADMERKKDDGSDEGCEDRQRHGHGPGVRSTGSRFRGRAQQLGSRADGSFLAGLAPLVSGRFMGEREFTVKDRRGVLQPLYPMGEGEDDMSSEGSLTAGPSLQLSLGSSLLDGSTYEEGPTSGRFQEFSQDDAFEQYVSRSLSMSREDTVTVHGGSDEGDREQRIRRGEGTGAGTGHRVISYTVCGPSNRGNRDIDSSLDSSDGAIQCNSSSVLLPDTSHKCGTPDIDQFLDDCGRRRRCIIRVNIEDAAVTCVSE